MPNGAAVTPSFLSSVCWKDHWRKKRKVKKLPSSTSQQLAAEDLDFYNAAPRERQGVYYLIKLEFKNPFNYRL